MSSKLEMVAYRRRYIWLALLLCISLACFAAALRTLVWAGQSAPPPQQPGSGAVTQDQNAHPEFPEGPGRDAVMQLCVRCHSPNIILASGKDRLGWEDTITKMVRLGATGDDEDFSDIADYLTAHFPPSPIQKVFVNMATDKQIADVLGVSLEDAKAIVTYRDAQKGFKSLDEMKQVPNVDQKNLDAKKDRLVFGAGAPKPVAK